ncbi:MAG: tryptophan 2,3-dioxygenase [Gemmatimonadaceae bacterium]|nr:tryptophan 2,3-dioxygenase [Chitinophagaceae bacterium]
MPNDQSLSMNYADYLRLDQILQSQHPESDLQKIDAHDEMLFIVIHQAYELWFKQLIYEVESVNVIMQKPALNDNSPELQTVVHRLSRCGVILKVLVHQIDIMETMTPMDFLDFRDLLRPASGFQSVQFKLLEAKLGLKFEHRHGQEHYVSQLNDAERGRVKEGESTQSLLQLVNSWLERMPFFTNDSGWADWSVYRNAYLSSLSEKESGNIAAFDDVFLSQEKNPDRSLSPAACRAAVFIMLYRGYPILQLPFQLLNNLLEIDEQLSTWRYRHMNMVHRMIGSRVGTGGSSGKEYLRAALDKHYIFREVAALTSFLIERRQLPALNSRMESQLGFVH